MIPCPNCKNSLGMDLTFIVKNPISQCPHCLVVLDFSGNKDIMKEYKNVLKEIEQIKKKSKGVTFS